MLPLEILAQAASESSEKLDQEILQRFMNKGAIVVIFLAIILIIFICFVVSWGRNVKRLVRRNRSEPSDQLENQSLKEGNRYLQIRVRRNEFFDVIRKGKPWEDLSIGFQCRIYRNPNVYNSDFWFHFTNQYISSRVQRDSIG